MSSFKQLSKADVTSVSYAANKQWTLPFTCPSLSNNYFNVYNGTFITGTFSPNNFIIDPVTNGQYERLVYDSINHLFYQKFSGSLNTGSLMFNVDTYQSASQQRPTGAYFDYNINPLLIKNFPTGSGAKIKVLGINQEIYGSKVLPNSFVLSSSAYNITDDGYGNLYNVPSVTNCEKYTVEYYLYPSPPYSVDLTYTDCLNSPVTYSLSPGDIYEFCAESGSFTLPGELQFLSSESCDFNTHVGNIFYAQGLAIITNPDYQNILPSPPIAVNDFATYLTSDSSVKTINVLANDVSRSCAIDTGSVVLSGSNSVYYTVNSNGTITLNTSASGNYDVYYTVNSLCGNGCSLTSNKAKVTVNVIPVNPPPCITVEFYGNKGGNNFWFVECGTIVTSSLSLDDTDAPVQKCIDGTFGVSGSTNYSYIGNCGPTSTPSGCSLYLLCGADRNPDAVFYYVTCSGTPVTESLGSTGGACDGVENGVLRCVSGSVTLDAGTPWGSYSLINLHCS